MTIWLGFFSGCDYLRYNDIQEIMCDPAHRVDLLMLYYTTILCVIVYVLV
jgi:hypothetical protein